MSRTKATTRSLDASSKAARAAPRGSQRDAYMLKLGHRIRGLREARGLTQAQCAQRTGLGADVVSRLENGRYTSPGLRTLLRIAESLAVPPSGVAPGPRAIRLHQEFSRPAEQHCWRTQKTTSSN